MKAVIRQFPPAGVVSRPVIDADIPRILKTMPIMVDLLQKKAGFYMGGVALAHMQVVDKDPLRFFVHRSGTYMINPEIIRHTRHKTDKKEGCLSYCTKRLIIVERYHVCEVRYQMIANDKLSDPIIVNLKGEDAQAVQHEIDHFDGINIYGEE